MILVLLIDFAAVLALIYISMRRGLEAALPLAMFLLIVCPEECKIPIFGLFDITTQRLVTITLLVLSFTTRPPMSTRLPRSLPLAGVIGAIAIWWTISTVNSLAMIDSLKALLALMLDYVTIYILFAKNMSSVASVKRILAASVFGVILCSFFGTLEAYGNWSVVSLFPTEIHRFGASGGLYLDDARGLRVQSTFGHPILFGSALAMAIPTGLYLLAESPPATKKALLWLGELLMFVCIFKTASRGPWLALALSLLPFLIFGAPKMRRYIAVIVLLTVTVLVVRPGVGETIWNDYVSTVDDHSSQGQSYQYRYALYELVIDKLAESPTRMIWGYGPQSFPQLHLSGTIDGRGMEFVSCDSSVAALLAETGYVGLLLMLGFLFYAFWWTMKAFLRLSRPADQLCLIFLVNLFAFYFEMTSVAILGWGQQTILLWILIAMTMRYPALIRHERNTMVVPSETEAHNLDGIATVTLFASSADL